jgi:predicted TIM-barrel fold metal-dependent hydrolase
VTSPSEYFRRNCWISLEADEEPARHFIEVFGDDRVVFSTDYPHGDSKYPDSIPAFDELPIPDESKVKILGPNWQSLYKIPLAKRR